MKTPTYSKELAVAKKIAAKSGKIMLKYFDNDQAVEVKGDKSLVTIADKLINTMVIKELRKVFPKDIVIGEEESTGEYGMGRRWICDPIDGTAGYVWGTPTAMFSIALVVDGVPVVGVLYDPFLKLLYTGVKGGKSFCNKKVLKVSNKQMNKGIFGLTGSVKHLDERKYWSALKTSGARFAAFSGAVYKYALIARGRLVGYIEAGLNPHDVAASHVILENAGGKVTDLYGKPLDYTKPFKGAIASNGVVHDTLVGYAQMDIES